MSNDQYSSKITPDIFTDEPVFYAQFWERFGAVFLDGLILIIPNFFLRYIFDDLPPVYFLSGMIIRWLYDALQESGVNQATLGKRALGIKVTDLEGRRISFSRASARHFGKYLSALILFIGYLMMLWDDRKQTLHDKMAGTLVIK